MTISENFKRFQLFSFQKDLLENKSLFKNTGVLFFSWKHKDWKRIISIQNCHIRSHLFKTNKILATKWTYHKERSFATNYFIFLKILFQFKNLLYRVFFVPTTQMPIFILFVSAWVSSNGAFFLWVSLSILTRIVNDPLLFYRE